MAEDTSTKQGAIFRLLGCVALMLLMIVSLARHAEAAAVTYHIVADNSTNLGADGTADTPNGYQTSRADKATAAFKTTFSTTAPTATETRFTGQYSVRRNYYSLARVYLAQNYAQAMLIGANPTGRVRLKGTSSLDRFQFILKDYDPNGVSWNGTVIASTGDIYPSTTESDYNISFAGAAYTVPLGHRLVLEILYYPRSANNTGYVYFNNAGHDSYITVDESTAGPPTYTITGTVTAGGVMAGTDGSTVTSATSPMAISVTQGNNYGFTITPDTGYKTTNVEADITTAGVYETLGVITTYTFNNVQRNYQIRSTFVAVPTYTITATSGANGSISPGTTAVSEGAGLTFTMSPNTGYVISDVLVDGASIGAKTTYSFTNVTAAHTISVTFSPAPQIDTYCIIPPYLAATVPPNVMIMLSVETPMQGAAHADVTCGPDATVGYKCTYSANVTTVNAGGTNYRVAENYNNATNYYGYFDPLKCYSYQGGGNGGKFVPTGAAANHKCGGTGWSGNFLNYATMTVIDTFRKAMTGGNRDEDAVGNTTLLGARQTLGQGHSWYPMRKISSDISQYMPTADGPAGSTRYIVRHANGFSVCSAVNCAISETGTGESRFPGTGGASVVSAYNLRIKVCDSSVGMEPNCNVDNNKPEGIMQKYADKMRFGLISYALTGNTDSTRDGGVIRGKMKWLIEDIPYGMKYHDNKGEVITCLSQNGCKNSEAELNPAGHFNINPDNATQNRNSGVINYINKFGYESGYKSLDPVAEMYYEVVRYFRNMTPSTNKFCDGIPASDDGFVAYCDQDKAATYGWRDPSIYPCSYNYVLAVNDANPWLDKRIPGTAFVKQYGTGTSSRDGNASSANDYCDATHPCDTDFTELSGTWGTSGKTGLQYWTDRVGSLEGITGSGKTMKVGCVLDSTGVCPTSTNWGNAPDQAVLDLSKVVGSYPWPGKENSYYMPGLAFYAHTNDMRPDLPGKNVLTTYVIDTQEPNSSMLVGKQSMLWLAAKYGGFEDKDGNGVPFTDSTCGTGSPAAKCAEWDVDGDSFPDTYFLASDPTKMEEGLTKAFTDMLRRMSSGTAASILSNSEGSGANLLQAVFYPQKAFDNQTQVDWIGELQNLWYYVDPFINNSTIREDTDYSGSGTHVFNLVNDYQARFFFDGTQTQVELKRDSNGDGTGDVSLGVVSPDDIHPIWRAGKLLWQRDVSTTPRKLFTTLHGLPASASEQANGISLLDFANLDTTQARIQSFLQASNEADADKIISFTNGLEPAGTRSRTVQWRKDDGTSYTGIWKLGDIVSSTPKLQSTVRINTYNLDPPSGYGDKTYGDDVRKTGFIYNNDYRNRGMVFVGANDGMLHAFKLGILDVTPSVYQKATLSGTGLGEEQWAYIPRSLLPFLKFYADPKYNHIYSVDGPTVVADVSIASQSTTCTQTDYWNCPKTDDTSWSTILIGSMGIGGASRVSGSACTDCVKTPTLDPDDGSSGLGYSSYFALDITKNYNPSDSSTYPVLRWEFNDPELGYATPGAAIVKINANSDPKSKNGRWFAVLASGPTGPIDTVKHQFLGRSDQNLKIFVLDLKTGEVVSKTSNGTPGPMDTGITNAFASSITNSIIDTERWNTNEAGKRRYQDDGLYIGYTQKAADGTWTQGGVLRIIIPDDTNPDAIDPTLWKMSKVIDGIGPVTSAISKLQDRKNHNLWLYFGTGRYFFNQDDMSGQRRIFGVRDLCYKASVTHADGTTTQEDLDDKLCVSAATTPAAFGLSDLSDQTAGTNTTLSNSNGWYIDLDAAGTSYGAERVISDPVAMTNGAVYYTSFKPNSDLCSFGGNSYLWAVKYDTGTAVPSKALQGKALLQLSTGSFEEKDLSSEFTDKNFRRSGSPMSGKPPLDPPPIISKSNLKPVKRIIHIQER